MRLENQLLESLNNAVYAASQDSVFAKSDAVVLPRSFVAILQEYFLAQTSDRSELNRYSVCQLIQAKLSAIRKHPASLTLGSEKAEESEHWIKILDWLGFKGAAALERELLKQTLNHR